MGKTRLFGPSDTVASESSVSLPARSTESWTVTLMFCSVQTTSPICTGFSFVSALVTWMVFVQP